MDRPIISRRAEHEELGAAPNLTWLIADADQTGGVMNVVRTVLGEGVDGPPPHYHKLSPEMFYLLDGAPRRGALRVAHGRIAASVGCFDR